MEVSAYYNLITSNQQMRAIRGIERQHVPVALTGAANIVLDELPASLRAPLLYRHLLLHFVPVVFDDYDFMLRPERFARLGLPSTEPDQPTESALEILDRNFRMPDLKMIPSSWGRSVDTLRPRMREVARIYPDQVMAATGAEKITAGAYNISGSVVFDLVPIAIRGRDVGLLQFDFSCPDSKVTPTIEIYWAEAGSQPDERTVVRFLATNGTLIVPLDAAPRWLLSKKLGVLRIDIADPAPCRTFTLSNIALAQRRDVDEMNTIRTNGEGP
jgi:hypothetical protein